MLFVMKATSTLKKQRVKKYNGERQKAARKLIKIVLTIVSLEKALLKFSLAGKSTLKVMSGNFLQVSYEKSAYYRATIYILF